MATQGILSIVVDGRVVAKAITGADGYEMPAVAADVRANNVTTAEGLLDLCHDHGLGGESLIVQASPVDWIGDCTEDELPCLYAEKFSDPRFNPRWKNGTADYVEVVDMTHNEVLGRTYPKRRKDMKVVEIVKAHFVREEFDGLIQTENGQDMAKQGPTGSLLDDVQHDGYPRGVK